MNRKSIAHHTLAPLPLLALALTLAVGCNVHEFPDVEEEEVVEEVGPVSFRLMLDFTTDLPLYQEVQYTSRAASSYQVRHVVNVYTPESDGTYGRTYDAQYVFTSADTDNLDTTLSIDLDEGDYKFMVWTDYVPTGTTADWYYDTGDFAEVALTDEYEGSSDYRDAFRGSVEAEVTAEADSATVSMSRPLAKFTFISEDLDEFITRALERIQAQLEAEGESSGQAIDEIDARSIDFDAYTVVFAYTSYMPCSYNLFTDRPADSATGMTFYGSISQTSDTEAELGFDYVFVNSNATSVQVALYVYDTDGTLIAHSDVITVPLLRSCLTTVRGDFLTSEAAGGVGISPDFDGQYNIEID